MNDYVIFSVYLVGVFLSWPLYYRMAFLEHQRKWPQLAHERGNDALFALSSAIVWPVSLSLVGLYVLMTPLIKKLEK